MTVGSMKQRIRRIAFALGAFAVFIPVSVSQSDGVTSTEACADNNTCCREFMSWCDDVSDHYSAINKCYPIDG